MAITRRECVKNINLCIEKILEHYSEIFELLKVSNSTKLNEMKSLVFSKKKMCEILENIEAIFQNFVQLKLIHRNFNLKCDNKIPQKGFKYIFEEMNKNLEF